MAIKDHKEDLKKALEEAFFCSRQGIGGFIDQEFKKNLAEELQKQDVKLTDWSGILKCWHGLHIGMAQTYIMTTLDVLGVGEKTVPKPKKKTLKKKKEKDLILVKPDEPASTMDLSLK